MPAWPGGPCPDCGDEMPPRLLRCQTCRAWLNEDLRRDDPIAPEPFKLPEIDTQSDPEDAGCLRARPTGHYVICPSCQRELRVADQYVGQTVACRFCGDPFDLRVLDDEGATDATTGTSTEPPVSGGADAKRTAFFLDCPHCKREIRASNRYMGHRVVCKHCDGQVQLAETTRARR